MIQSSLDWILLGTWISCLPSKREKSDARVTAITRKAPIVQMARVEIKARDLRVDSRTSKVRSTIEARFEIIFGGLDGFLEIIVSEYACSIKALKLTR